MIIAAWPAECCDLIASGRPVEFPVQRLQSDVVASKTPALAFAEVGDGIALLAWTFKDALFAALDREIDARADDKHALTPEARAKAEAEVMADLLSVEREECALVWRALSQNLPVFHRNDCSPLAILQCGLVRAPTVSACREAARGWPSTCGYDGDHEPRRQPFGRRVERGCLC